jgi:hypothetical protein
MRLQRELVDVADGVTRLRIENNGLAFGRPHVPEEG